MGGDDVDDVVAVVVLGVAVFIAYLALVCLAMSGLS